MYVYQSFGNLMGNVEIVILKFYCENTAFEESQNGFFNFNEHRIYLKNQLNVSSAYFSPEEKLFHN